MKKRLFLILLSVFLIFSLCSCDTAFINDIFGNDSVQDAENMNTPDGSTDKSNEYDESYFINALSGVTSDKVFGVYIDDYDFDGVYEAYILTSKGEIPEDALHCDGISLWFIKENSVKLLCDSGDFYLTPKAWEFSDKVLFCVDRFADGTDMSNVFFVSGRSAYSYGEFSARLERKDDSNEFFAFVPGYDSVYKVASHSYQGENVKPYYLYFDGNFFCEYAGLLITYDDLKAYSGAQEILSAIAAGGYTAGDIFYRSNGIINMNISKDGAGGIVLLENVTLMLREGNICLLTKNRDENTASGLYENGEASSSVIENKFSETELFSFGGLYSAAAFPDIAVYPENNN